MVSFDDEVPVSHPNGRVCKEFILARQVVESSHIINIPKMKTHGLMTYTGAVKNLFGCIPGTLKARMHLRFQSAEEFSLMLLDSPAAVRPYQFLTRLLPWTATDRPTAGPANSAPS